MNVRLCVLLLAALTLVTKAQNTLPPDIHPKTLSRLPPVTADDLDESGQRLLAARTNFTPGPGPTHITVYSPRELDLGIPSGEKSPVGPRYFQLAVLIIAREIDQQYEWSAHELAGRRQGLEQSVIDVVKYNRDVAGLSYKGATGVTFWGAPFCAHPAGSEISGKKVSPFLRPRTGPMMMIIGEYFSGGLILESL